MKIDVETHDCLGQPIIATVERQSHRCAYGYAEPEQAKCFVKERLQNAISYRADPNRYARVSGERDPRNLSEWAFVMEQLAAEGFFKAEKP